MKENKGVSVPKHYLKQTERIYEVYTYKTQNDRRFLYNTSKDVGCQYEYRRPDREMYYSGLSKQVYAYHGTRSVTDVGVGSVKALPRKRIKRIYLPETDDRGIGSEDLSVFVTRRNRPTPRSCYYDFKKTSSKCVGGSADYRVGCVLSEKLSPIVQTRSKATSPSDHKTNTEMASNTVGNDMITITTQVEYDFLTNIQDNTKRTEDQEAPNPKPIVTDCQQQSCSKGKEHTALDNSKIATKKNNLVDRGVSSDSLVQHVHNLENPSDYKQSHASIDPMENKLEREYRKMFTAKPKDKKAIVKPIPDMKSASILRRRFEALRRGMIKKEDSTKNAVIEKEESNQPNCPVRKDVSIASDPPSLEGRSYSNTKTYSPFHMKTGPEKPICKPSTSRKKPSDKGDCLQWPQVGEDYSDSQGVKGMFKLWGKKFDFEEDSGRKRFTPVCSYSRVNTFTKHPDKKAELKLEKTVKKDGKKFFCFKKRSKEKSKPYKSKKGLTAGRCEVGEGLLIKIDGNIPAVDESKKRIDMSNEILRQQWLSKYLTPNIESNNRVQIRWNNNIYATSSSTVFELMDTVYQGAGIVFRSKSEVTTGESSFYKSRTQHVNFAHQEIEAWMIPKTVVDTPKQKHIKIKRAISKHNTEVRMSAQKWFIDKAKAFSRKIEVVLHTKNVIDAAKESSSEYLRIDIPKGCFIESSSDDNRKASSDEEVFKIVVYETASDLKRNNLDMDTGDQPINDRQLFVKNRSNFEPNIVENVNKSHVGRDVVIQVSDVNIPKPCDVIGVGIITQKDLREIRKPILKIHDNLTDEESTHILSQSQKKCEFAESFLQDYYRHWTPLGIERYTWGVTESHLISNSKNSQASFHNQGDGSKSCFNIYDGFQTSAVLSSNNECEPCAPDKIIPHAEYTKAEQDNCFKSKLLKKLHIKKSGITDAAKRSAPKDSFEVFKKRKLYAASDKSKWMSPSFCDMNLSSMPSIEETDTKSVKGCLQKKPCRKHVSVKEDGTYQYIPKSEGSQGGILMFRGASGCDVCRGAVGVCPKHAKVDPVSCEIPDPPCMTGCVDGPNPPCSAVPSPNKKLAESPSNTQDLLPPACFKTEKSNESLNKNCPKLNVSSQNKCLPCNLEPPKYEATVLCPHFPPCRVSQSCQKSLDSLQDCLPKCPSKTQSSEREKNKSPDCIASPCLSKNLNEVKTSSIPKHNPSPCQNPRSPSPCQKQRSPIGSSEFPWPLKSQNSNQSVTEPPACIQCKCSEDSPLSPELSANSVTLTKVSSVVDCKANCGSPLESNPMLANKKNLTKSPTSRVASPIKKCVSAPLADGRENKRNLSRISVKIKQSPKKDCKKDSSPVNVTEGDEAGIIHLNSKERITISMKKPTASTEEIREGMNIKVRDYDGNTLYERRDYKKGQRASRPAVLGDMYKSSDVKRISTPLIIKNIQTSQEREQPVERENKSDTSIGNVIEIQFKLKITPGDRSTELNTEKNKNIEAINKITKSEIKTPPQDVFVVKNSDDHMSAKSSVKNDVNIRIVIKNLKTKADKKKNAKYNDDFSKKISSKFQTVSTGYSDVYTGQNIDKGFSIHRATIDLTDSNEKSKTQTKQSENKNRVEFANPEPKIITSSHKLKRSLSTTKIETDVTAEKPKSAEELNNQENVEDIQSDLPDEYVRPVVFTDSEDQDILDTTSTAESGILATRPLNKEQKKELLKKVFEKADKTKVKSKDKMKKLRDMLKVVLTSDSSGHDEMAVTSNELLKDITFTSLRPDFFKDTDSFNNPYNIDSILSLENINERKYYPTGEQNSECSRSDEEPLKVEPAQGCMCSTFADRLKLCNLSGGGCCCRGNQMLNEEVSCDIKIEDAFPYMEDAVVELVDVETQNSKILSSKSDSKKSNLIKNELEIQFGEITSNCPIKDNDMKNPQIDFAHADEVRNSNILNRNIALNISGEDRNILLKATPTNVSFDPKKRIENKTPKMLTPSDILQSHAAKKAVLEIYADTMVDADGERTVAKLPKFMYEKESEIYKYQQKLCNYNTICKKNIVLMSVQR